MHANAFCYVVSFSLALVACAGAPACAETFPTRTITIIVPYPAGGPVDAAARVVAPHLAATLGQSVVIENVSGGAANIGTARVARATPDGYTVLFHNLNIASNVALYTNLSFDTEKNLSGLGLVNFSPFVLVARKDIPAKSTAELLAWMKQTGRQIRFAHVGAGSVTHLGAILLAKWLGIEVNLIPYRGAAPVLSDLAAGHVDVYFATTGSAGALIKSGVIKAFAVTSNKRDATLPDVPSFVELGAQSLEIVYWQALFVPAGTPKDATDRLAQALQLALADAKVIKSFEDFGTSVYPKNEQTPAATSDFLHKEILRWGDVIRTNKIDVAQ